MLPLLTIHAGSRGIIVADLATGESWRHLDLVASVQPKAGFLPTLFGIPTYQSSAGSPAYKYPVAAGGGIDGAFRAVIYLLLYLPRAAFYTLPAGLNQLPIIVIVAVTTACAAAPTPTTTAVVPRATMSTTRPTNPLPPPARPDPPRRPLLEATPLLPLEAHDV